MVFGRASTMNQLAAAAAAAAAAAVRRKWEGGGKQSEAEWRGRGLNTVQKIKGSDGSIGLCYVVR